MKTNRLEAFSDGVMGMRLALVAVIAEKNGSLSYWALAHPPHRPDFHHAEAFVLVLERSGVLGDWYRRL